MEKIKRFVFRVIFIGIILILSSCVSSPSPIVIYKMPTIDISDDITIEQYLHSSTEYGINMTNYTLELINQIINKVPYIDCRN